ncbi:LamG domain-containing protein [Candidatus Nanosalina sp. VS9-1]|uniref:LamG domain-containing protein n=1 Tax=Candidatus Nanosalina sp. VS9-1 TaxID=3388566 RepID=UPI0039E10238
MTRDISQASTHPDKVRPASAVSRWSMDSSDVSSGTLQDSWGSNDGSLNGGITTGASGVGGSEAFSFDGSDDYVAVGDVLGGFTRLTVSSWVKVTGSSSNSSYNVVVGNSGAYVLSYQDDTDDFLFRLGLDGGKVDLRAGIGSVINTGWYHITGTWDGSKQRIYVNGSKVSEQSASGTMGDTSGKHMIMGSLDTNADGQGQSKYMFKGKIDEVRIYSEALSQQQVWKLYNVGRNANWGFSRS